MRTIKTIKQIINATRAQNGGSCANLAGTACAENQQTHTEPKQTPRGWPSGAIGSAVVLALSLAVATSRADLNYAGFTSTAGLNLLGDATQVGTALRLTRSHPDLVGAAWYTTKQSVAGGFETPFSLRISPFAYADGIEFVT